MHTTRVAEKATRRQIVGITPTLEKTPTRTPMREDPEVNEAAANKAPGCRTARKRRYTHG